MMKDKEKIQSFLEILFQKMGRKGVKRGHENIVYVCQLPMRNVSMYYTCVVMTKKTEEKKRCYVWGHL